MNSFSQINSFYKSPACKVGLGWITVSSMIMNFPLRKFQYLLECDYGSVFVKKEVWRVPLSSLVFLDITDLIFACVLIYQFKKFERRYGTQKFIGCLCGLFLLSQLLTLASLYTVGLQLLEPLSTGPISVVFAFFVPFYLDIPKVTRGTLLGVPISGKSLAYIAGLQVAVSSIESIMLTFIGLISGILYRQNFLYIKNISSIPSWLGTTTGSLLGGVLESTCPVLPAEYGATLEIQRAEAQERLEESINWAELIERSQQNNVAGRLAGMSFAQAAAAPLPPPTEEQINHLVEMGFPRDNVLDALRQTGNDVTRATNRLLGI